MENRLAALVISVSIILSGCGGGGGGSSAANTPVPQVATIAGSVLGTNGSALSFVAINLSGAASTSTTSDASGNYQFASLLPGVYLITPTLPGVTFLPANIPITLNGQNITASTIRAETYASTQLILTNMAANYSPLFPCTYNSCGTSNVSTFVDNSLAYIAQEKTTLTIDDPAISSEFASYKAQFLAAAATTAAGYAADGPNVPAAIYAELVTGINAAFAAVPATF